MKHKIKYFFEMIWELKDEEKEQLDQQFHILHLDHIQQFFEKLHLTQNIIQNLLHNESAIKQKMSQMEIPTIRLFHEEFQTLHQQLLDTEFQLKELTYQIHQHNIISTSSDLSHMNNPIYKKMIEERIETRRILQPFWNSILQKSFLYSA